jgi:hypothetical protein
VETLVATKEETITRARIDRVNVNSRRQISVETMKEADRMVLISQEDKEVAEVTLID